MPPSPRLCIDVSNTVEAASLSGIQRVTLELGAALGELVDVVRLDGRSGRLVRLHPGLRRRLERLRDGSNRRSLAQRLEGKIVRSSPMRPLFRPNSIDVLIDIEASWHAPMQRAELLPQWESPSAALIHDILPLTNPEWFPADSVSRFRSWFDAHVSADSTLLAVSNASADAVASLGTKRPTVIRLGHTGATPISEGGGILMIGTIEPRKGHSIVLDALDLLGDEAPVIDVVGRSGWDTTDLVARLDRHPQVRWHRSVSDVELESLWQLSGMVLQPSLGEGFGLPVIDALQRGVAVVSSDIPVMSEVGRGQTTQLPFDAAAWAETLAAYAADPAAWPRPRRLDWPSWRDAAMDTLQALTDAGVWPDAASSSQ